MAESCANGVSARLSVDSQEGAQLWFPRVYGDRGGLASPETGTCGNQSHVPTSLSSPMTTLKGLCSRNRYSEVIL